MDPRATRPFGEAYKITNLLTGATYIGITRQSAAARFAMHIKASRREDSVLYRAMRKYGIAAFAVEALALAYSPRELSVLERALIAEHGTYVAAGGYNMTGGGEGSPDICPETRARMRVAAKTRWLNPKTKLKIIAANTGRKQSAEVREKRAAKQRGRPLSSEHRQKLSERHKGKTIPAAQRAAISAALTGRQRSPAAIEAARLKMVGRPSPAAVNAKISAALLASDAHRRACEARKGVPRSAEDIAKITAGLRTPEAKARLSQAQRRRWARQREATQ